jgi:hypothetical protein
MSGRYVDRCHQGETVTNEATITRDNAKLADDESGYFADGTLVARVDRLPWTPLNDDGAEFKLLAVFWELDMFVMLARFPGNIPVSEHYHLGAAHGYNMTGSFEYPEYARAFPGDYLGEPADHAHSATVYEDDCLQLSIIFGGLAEVNPDGTPDLASVLGCAEAYDIARAAGAAPHISPPPPGWSSLYKAKWL